MEDNLPYCLSVSFQNAVAQQHLEVYLPKEGFEKFKSELVENDCFEHFMITASGDLSPLVVLAADLEGFVERFTMIFPIGIHPRDLEISFRFLAQLDAFQPAIRDQEIQNQHFLHQLKNLTTNGQELPDSIDKFIDSSFSSNDTIISSDFGQFKLNSLNITKRALILKSYHP